MSKTKFMVIKLKELIKTIIFAIIGAAIIIALIIVLIPKSADAQYKSGTYTTNVSMGDETASLSLTFSENKITNIDFIPTSSTLEVFYPLVQTTADEICAQILSSQTTDNINLDSEHAAAGEIILGAADACNERAKR